MLMFVLSVYSLVLSVVCPHISTSYVCHVALSKGFVNQSFQGGIDRKSVHSFFQKRPTGSIAVSIDKSVSFSLELK